MEHNFFVTGTDTNVGKTLASSILVQLINGYYWKPVQAGMESRDCETVKQLVGLADNKIISSRYEFCAPLSPDQAAKRENIQICLTQLKMPTQHSPLIIEGAGGICVPLNENFLMIDLMKQYGLPVVIVARGTLGTINHTLLTIRLLQSNSIDIHGVIFNGELNTENQEAIEKWGKVKTLFHIPYFEKLNQHTVLTWINNNKEKLKKVFL